MIEITLSVEQDNITLDTDFSVTNHDPSAAKHIIRLVFTDETDTEIEVFYNDPLVGEMITAYEPSTYDGKTVALVELD